LIYAPARWPSNIGYFKANNLILVQLELFDSRPKEVLYSQFLLSLLRPSKIVFMIEDALIASEAYSRQ
jgi:hypothetical protein